MNLTKIRLSSNVVARFVREIPTESRETYLKQRKSPQYISECKGTPRREYPVNMLEGIRLRPTFNPYHELTLERINRLKEKGGWKSRKWSEWNPYQCYAQSGDTKYNIPADMQPLRNELGLLESPRLTTEQIDDIKEQYTMNGLPWVWDKDFYSTRVKESDIEPEISPKICKETGKSNSKIKNALRGMDKFKLIYLKEKRESKRYLWWERVIKDLAGEDAMEQYARIRKVPRLL